MTSISTSTSAFYDRAKTDIATLRKRAETLQEQLGGGDKLSRSSDDPVAASRLRVLSRANSLSSIDESNANRANADLTLADSALKTFADYIIRAKELATYAALTSAGTPSLEAWRQVFGNTDVTRALREYVGQYRMRGYRFRFEREIETRIGEALRLSEADVEAAFGDLLRHVGPEHGSVPAGGATQWLPLVVGDRRAREIVMLCEQISPQQALDWGLVTRVVPRERLDAEVAALAANLARKLP